MSGYYTIICNVNITKKYKILYHKVEYSDSIRLFVILSILMSYIFLIFVILTLYYNNSLNHDAVLTDYATIMSAYGTIA